MAEPTAGAGVPSPKARLLFIDLYRSAVILLMLEGHFVRTFLSADLQRSTFFQVHEFIHGLSAPAFLFGAGLTFIVSTRQRWIEYHHWGPPLARRIRRLLFVLLIGLALHLPYFSIRKIVLEGTSADFLQLFQSDVLTCIGIGLISLHAVVFFFKTESRFYGLVLSATLIVCFLTPIVWDADFLHSAPPFISQLFDGRNGSPFPLFPYVGFLFAGVIVSWEFLVASEQHRERQFMVRLFAIGAAFLLAGILFDALPIRMYPTYNYWYTSPNYFFVRIGCVMFLTAGSWLVAARISSPSPLLTVFGKESLFIYALHLPIIYGSVVNPSLNLRSMSAPDHGAAETAMYCLLFIAIMLGCAVAWNYLKRKHFNIYRLIQLGTSAVFLYLLFTHEN